MYVVGVFQGLWGAVKGTAHAIVHPIDTVQGVSDGLGTLAGRTIYDTAALGTDIRNVAIDTVTDPLALGNAVGNIEGGLLIGAGSVRALNAARAAIIFKHGKLLQRTIQTRKGPVDVLAEIVVQGDTLVLKDIAIFGRGQAPLKGLTRDMFEAIYELREQARAAGFKTLRITGKRIESSTSVNPGHVVDMTIDLTK